MMHPTEGTNGSGRFRGKVVVVSGASAGVGRATARQFAAEGATLALLARDPHRLEAACQEARELGGHAIAIAGDVADSEFVESAAERAERELGPIDVWVNNAMVTILAPVHEIAPEEFRRVTEVTYLGTVYGTMAALRRMRPRNRGTIVQVGSALSYRAIPLQSAYCGAKHAIRGFTDSLRSELLHDQSNIHLTMVQLPGLNTPQFSWCLARLPKHPQPVAPIFQPEVAARAIVWAAWHRRRELIVGRSSWMTIWGNKFFPGLGDRYLADNAFEGQQTDQPISPDRPHNLYDPVPGDQAAHGIFDDKSERISWQSQATRNRELVLAGAATLAGVVGGLLLAVTRSR